MTGPVAGDLIEVVGIMDDPDPIPVGTRGIVVKVTSGHFAQIWVDWIDSTRTLALLPQDPFRIVRT